MPPFNPFDLSEIRAASEEDQPTFDEAPFLQLQQLLSELGGYAQRGVEESNPIMGLASKAVKYLGGSPGARAEAPMEDFGAGLGLDTTQPPKQTITDEQIAEMLQSGMFVMRGNRAGTEEDMASALAHRDKQRRGETGSFSMTPSPGFTAPSVRMMNEALAFKRAQAANEQAGKYDAEKLTGRVSDVDKKGAYNLLATSINANLIADPQLTEKLRAAIAAGNLSEQDLAMLLEQIKASRPAKGS